MQHHLLSVPSEFRFYKFVIIIIFHDVWHINSLATTVIDHRVTAITVCSCWSSISKFIDWNGLNGVGCYYIDKSHLYLSSSVVEFWQIAMPARPTNVSWWNSGEPSSIKNHFEKLQWLYFRMLWKVVHSVRQMSSAGGFLSHFIKSINLQRTFILGFNHYCLTAGVQVKLNCVWSPFTQKYPRVNITHVSKESWLIVNRKTGGNKDPYQRT